MNDSAAVWSIRSIEGRGDSWLMIENLDELETENENFRIGRPVSQRPIGEARISMISEEEGWLDLPEDSRDLTLDKIMAGALSRVPRLVYPSERIVPDAFVNALLESGATNLQPFPVTLHHPYTDRSWAGYQLLNVVGLVNLDRDRNFVVAVDEKQLELVFCDAAKQKIEGLGLGVTFMKRWPRLP